MRALASLLGAITILATSACAHTYIDGTSVRDTDANREILGVLAHLRKAFEARDVEGILSIVSKRYFEDNGNADPNDDYGYNELANQYLKESMAVAQEVQLAFKVHDLVVEGQHAHADIRYYSRARLALASGSKWDSQREFDRVRFAREDGKWRITGGL